MMDLLRTIGLDGVLRAAGNLYLLLALAGVCVALWKGKTWPWKLTFAALVLVAFVAPGVPGIYRSVERRDTAAKAGELFAERCKTAGERIHRTVDAVDGIYLMKVRPEGKNLGDQFKLDDPYGNDLRGDAYIMSFLRGSYPSWRPDRPDWPARAGYLYVEAKDPQSGQRYRYTGSLKPVRKKDATAPAIRRELQRDPTYDLNIYDFVLDKVPAQDPRPRYGVTYEDISTREDREYWIAGSSLKVIDLQTNEVIAERIGYMMDRAQGSKAGGRSPWLLAADNACPSFDRFPGARVQTPSSAKQRRQTADFVEKVLRPVRSAK